MMLLKATDIASRAQDSNPGNCIPLINCGGLIRSGDFVRFEGSHHTTELLVGQIIAISDHGKVPSNERRACGDARLGGSNKDA